MSGTVGIVMLVHADFDRAGQVIRHWVAGGCPVAVHVDAKVSRSAFDGFRASLSDLDTLRFSRRFRCEWGTWGIVAASQAASELLLGDFPQVRHVYLASGACLPLRPVSELRAYLDARPDTDFTESATMTNAKLGVVFTALESDSLNLDVSLGMQYSNIDGLSDFIHFPDDVVDGVLARNQQSLGTSGYYLNVGASF